jgi:DNA-binding MarR family transcriptional regulator
MLGKEFRAHGFSEVQPSYGLVLVPLFEEDGLRIGELASRSHLAKPTMTTMVRLVEHANLVKRRPDPSDRRATGVHLTTRGRAMEPIATAAVTELERRLHDLLGPRRRAAFRASIAGCADLGAQARSDQPLSDDYPLPVLHHGCTTSDGLSWLLAVTHDQRKRCPTSPDARRSRLTGSGGSSLTRNGSPSCSRDLGRRPGCSSLLYAALLLLALGRSARYAAGIGGGHVQ